MRDLRLVSAKSLLAISTVSPIRGFLPPSVIVSGKDLYRATEVEYNDVLVTEFIVAERDRLIVRVPESQVGKDLRTITALAPISVTRTDALLRIGVTTPIQAISGVERLVQAWIILFFSTPGSDIFDRSGGGGAIGIIGKATDRSHKSAAAAMAMAVDKAKSDLIRKQAQSRNVPLDEQLLSSTLDSVTFEPNSSTLRATVSLRNMLGETASVALR
jgi:hypothetical protein